MEDLVGLGRSAEKFLSLIQSSIGTLYRPRAIRKEGEAAAQAEAYKIVALAKANSEAKGITLLADQELAERAVSRLRHQEIEKQKNLESIIDQTIPKIENEDVTEEVDRDWLAYFFESCAGISEKQVQELWSDVLASKISGSPLPRKVLDCLRWMDAQSAKQFRDFSELIFLFDGFFDGGIEFDDYQITAWTFPFDGEALAEIGLVRENLNKTFRFSFASLEIECREFSDRSLEFRGFYEFTQAGRKLASIVVPSLVDYSAKARDFDGYSYSDEMFQAQNSVIPSLERIRLVAGQLVNFLVEIDGEIQISKSIIETVGETQVHTSGPVMRISAIKSSLEVNELPHSPHWEALSDYEKLFLKETTSFFDANSSTITHR